MWEILGELAVLLGDGPLRALRARRALRRLRAGKQTRLPCAVRSDRPGWPAEYTNGSLLFTPGQAEAAFGSRAYPYLLFPVGGELLDPEPEAWHDQDWAAKLYTPAEGDAVHIQVHSRYLPALATGVSGRN
ncbi:MULTISPECIES: hypothetical protein [unclassified Kitasatospora]|uniref:hypothetical protein n=1 Tax=unclassified Kitasatospora TaxID=2633591 RepID=UPI00070E032E|nr:MULTISPECIES: hypothetical protein [unclassified Kitasatospora]KQV18358.1 hypothetical protein ASC99_03730 [Kitasatospora sp. Root107]KRB74344.1 hypothetical protein ASE03_17645 [Kitasatospora sp. Root187]